MIRQVRYITGNNPCMTVGKVYDVMDENFSLVKVFDDEGDDIWFTKDNFELVEEG